MEFRQLEAFVNSVKLESFSKAAQALGLTQPTISAHIINLEQELGVTLLNRTCRDLSLTKQGELFYLYAVDMLNTRSRARTSVQKLSETIEGMLAICASGIPGRYYLPRLMGTFLKRHPKLHIHVNQSEGELVAEHIISQKGEIGLTEWGTAGSLICEPVFTDEMVMIVPDTKPYSQWPSGSSVDIKEFQNEPFILNESGSGVKTETDRAVIDCLHMLEHINITMKMNDLESVKETVARGAGISIVSRIAVEASDMEHRIKFFRINGLDRRNTFYMVYRRGICLSPVAEAFRSLVLEDCVAG